MSVRATLNFGGSIRETLTAGVEFAENPTVTHRVGGSVDLTSASTPDIEKFGADEPALAAGAATLDLTSLKGTNGVTVDGTGLRPRWIYLKNTGVADITFTKGASNGNDMFAGSWTFTLRPGEEKDHKFSAAGPSVVGGTNKIIDITGTGADTFQYAILLG